MKYLHAVFWPVAAFIGALALHAAWYARGPSEVATAQARWVTVDAAPWQQAYLQGGEIWLGLSIASAAAFALWALRRWWMRRSRIGATAAVGSLTCSGILAAAGCFLSGCCGSPMLAVWISLLGATAVPWLKPASLGITLLTIGLGVWWVLRAERRSASCPPCDAQGCGCRSSKG